MLHIYTSTFAEVGVRGRFGTDKEGDLANLSATAAAVAENKMDTGSGTSMAAVLKEKEKAEEKEAKKIDVAEDGAEEVDVDGDMDAAMDPLAAACHQQSVPSTRSAKQPRGHKKDITADRPAAPPTRPAAPSIRKSAEWMNCRSCHS